MTRGQRMRFLHRFSAASWTLAGALVAVVSLRLFVFAWGEVSSARADAPPETSETPLSPSDQPRQPFALEGQSVPPELERILRGEAARSGDAMPRPTASALRPNLSRRIMLVVSGDDESAEVIVNEQHVGRLPFLGDITCKTGQPVVVKVVPRRGEPWSRQLVCRGETMRVSP